MAKIKYREALRTALRDEMRRDASVFCLGEGIGARGGSYKVTEGLFAEFGAGRVIDMPLSEAGFVGLGAGAAIAGARPVVEFMFIDFFGCGFDGIMNQAAKFRYMFGGSVKVPLVYRGPCGAGRRAAGQHSQSPYAIFAHIPGLKVVVPSTPYEAKGLLTTAIRDDDPVAFLEHKLMYTDEGEVPEEEYVVPLGRADVKRAGTDVTLVAWSHMVTKALQAAELMGQEGIHVEVIDLRTVAPMDTQCILDSVRRTGRLVVAQEAVERGGVASDVAALVAERAFDDLRAPIVRVAGKNTVIPFNLALEKASIPQVVDIVTGLRVVTSDRAGSSAQAASPERRTATRGVAMRTTIGWRHASN